MIPAAVKLYRGYDYAMDNDAITLDPKYVVDAEGRRNSVLLTVAEFDALLERLEELEDALEFDEAVRTSTGFRSLAEVGDELKREGRIQLQPAD